MRFATALLLPAALTPPLHAGTIRDDRADSLYTGLAADADFASVGRFDWNESGQAFFASGTLIRDDWVLTAAHVIDGTDGFGAGVGNLRFLVGGATYSAADWLPHPNWQASGGESNLFAGWDIGLVRLEQAVSNVAPATLFTDRSELSELATLVGFGATGNGLTGATQFAGTKRAENNLIDVVGSLQTIGSDPRFRFGHDRLVAVDFDEPGDPSGSTLGNAFPMNLEYLTAPGDSGGGLFLEVGGEQLLAGVTSLGSTIDGATDSTYGDRASFTRVSSFLDWIDATIAASSVTPLAGAFDGDGAVTAADYAAWRDTSADVDAYNLWRSGFGQSVPPAAAAGFAVPEPGAVVVALAAMACAAGVLVPRRTRSPV